MGVAALHAVWPSGILAWVLFSRYLTPRAVHVAAPPQGGRRADLHILEVPDHDDDARNGVSESCGEFAKSLIY